MPATLRAIVHRMMVHICTLSAAADHAAILRVARHASLGTLCGAGARVRKRLIWSRTCESPSGSSVSLTPGSWAKVP
jgi:hypothetical protein